MKRWLVLILCAALLTGCSSTESELERGMALRANLLAGSCSFRATVTADYADKAQTFTLDCIADGEGNVAFTVAAPESIAGITGQLSAAGGQLTFDDTALSFEMLAEGEISPVSGPWILIHTLRSGYLNACGMEGESLRLTIDDSYEADALQLDIWLDSQDLPRRAEILWRGRRVLAIEVEGFTFV